MASLFQTISPDWDATLPPRGYEYDPFPTKRAGERCSLDDSDLDAAPPFPPIHIAGPNDIANHRIGVACVIMSLLIFVMVIAQLIRAAIAGTL